MSHPLGHFCHFGLGQFVAVEEAPRETWTPRLRQQIGHCD